MAAVIHQYFFPSILAGVALAVVWRFVSPGLARTALQVIASLLFFLPQLGVMYFGGRSMQLVLHRNAVLALWLVAGGAFAVWQAAHSSRGAPVPTAGSRGGRVRSPLVVGAVGVLVGAGGLWLGSIVAKDIVLPRAVVEGVVTRTWVTIGRGGPYWHVAVNGAPLNVTQDVYAKLRPSMRVRVRIGAGSDTVLAVESRP